MRQIFDEEVEERVMLVEDNDTVLDVWSFVDVRSGITKTVQRPEGDDVGI